MSLRFEGKLFLLDETLKRESSRRESCKNSMRVRSSSRISRFLYFPSVHIPQDVLTTSWRLRLLSSDSRSTEMGPSTRIFSAESRRDAGGEDDPRRSGGTRAVADRGKGESWPEECARKGEDAREAEAHPRRHTDCVAASTGAWRQSHRQAVRGWGRNSVSGRARAFHNSGKGFRNAIGTLQG